jgi:hypothetical protein
MEISLQPDLGFHSCFSLEMSDYSLERLQDIQSLIILYLWREYHSDQEAFASKKPLVETIIENALKFDLSSDNRRFFIIKYQQVAINHWNFDSFSFLF